MPQKTTGAFLQEYIVALSYFAALAIVCVVLYSFTYFLPKPDNTNKAKSTFYFRLVLLFTIASFEAVLLRYEHLSVVSLIISNLFILLIAYNLMFAVFTRYDHQVTGSHYALCAAHCVVFIGILFIINNYYGSGLLRAAVVLINVGIPYIFTIKKCNQQFKKYRLGDRVLYGSILVVMLIFIAYIAIYALFFFQQKNAPLALYFIALLSFICVLFFGFALSIIYSLVGKLRKEIITDRLTGAKNRNYLKEVSGQLMSIAKRNNTPLSLILCDIDWFKRINDTYGHLAGDKVLKVFSSIVKKSLRSEDILIRIGGEEFVILLPHNDLSQAQQTAERLRVIVNEHTINVEIEDINISACFGVAQMNLDSTIDDNINNADIALYEAKRSGRNKVVIFNSKPGE